MCRIAVAEAGGPQICAALDMIAMSELGAKLLAASDDGYDILVGSTPWNVMLFHGYEQHPNKLQKLRMRDPSTNEIVTIHSTAAGRYQQIFRTWAGVASQLKLPDFSPLSQDRACIKLLMDCGAFTLFQLGRAEQAIEKARRTWASLPGAGYGQPEHSLAKVLGWFITALDRYSRPDFTNVQAGSDTTAPAK